ncbi:formyl-CoA transferase [Pueribacillus theae]|uniref:Formyl-CoA transferase n=1 Tax=Pueribacillus theae TaxID=2171751 RepID=A0A2U1JVI5_9BACI|nr:CaiB/BaiF CoA-transferase family protein [Pueribacillus theae]PWA09217.1 formyl-CoA transferase [Pueribacillus theae]
MVTPLEGIKVLELARTLAGPVTGQLLGDLGADVIKVEQPNIGDESRRFSPPDWDGESCYFLSSNRNKRSITVDLKSEKGKKIIYELVKKSDVLIENFRTGAQEKLGIDYETLKKINPRLVYVSISGFGRTGPEKYRAGYDLLLQAYSGLMSTTGEKGKPYKAGPSVVDMSTGILGALGAMAALMAREKTGEGQYVDCSLLDGQVMMLNHLATGYFATGKSAEPMGQGHHTIVPYQVFKAKDKDVVIAAANDSLWQKMCQALGWEDLLEIEEYKTNKQRVANREKLVPILSERIEQLISDEVCGKLDDVGVPCGPINTVGEVVTSPQAVARGMMAEIDHPTIKGLKTPAFPIKLSDTPASVRHYPPRLGEHTEEVLSELGLQKDEISKLNEEGII